MSRNKNFQGDEFNLEEELQKKIKLSDGTEEFLYSRGPKISDAVWPIQCFLCRWTCIVNAHKFKTHIVGEKHLENLRKANEEPPEAEKYREPYHQIYSDRINYKNPIKIYPGEDILELTPEYEDRLLPIKFFKWDNPPSEKVTEQLTPDIIMDYNQECPILGLCYGFKMAKNGKVRYFCALCKKDLDESNAYQHFVSKEHSAAYAKAHYPQTIDMLPIEMNGEQKIDLVRYYYNKIENLKGRRHFYLVNSNYFDALPDKFLPRAAKIYHYNETTIKYPEEDIMKTAEMILSGKRVVPKFLEKLPGQPESEEDFLKIDSSDEAVPKEELEEKSRSRRDRKRPSDEKESERIKKLGLNDSPANWQKYRIFLDKALQKLNSDYQRFLDISERHPRYQDEWRRFYRLKSEQLRRDRINPKDYNYMQEWNRYWLRFLEDCYNVDSENCRYELRKTLKLPFRTKTPPPVHNIVDKNSVDIETDKKGPVPLMELAISNPFRNQFDNGSSHTDIYDRNDRRGNDIGGGSNNTNNSSMTATKPPQSLMQEEQMQKMQNQPKPESSGPISVLSVLRLLAALEFELGSLGPIVNQLLVKAVLYEKESKLSANELLHEEEYFTLFVTAMEKLKGVIEAGVISETKVFATKRCITDLETILNLFEEYLRRNPNAAQKHVKSSIVLSGVKSLGGGGGDRSTNDSNMGAGMNNNDFTNNSFNNFGMKNF